jgi:L-2,4-diaminobutyrate decarboxylase
MENTMESIQARFNPERFREQGHWLVDLLAGYLKHAVEGFSELPVLPWRDPEDMAGRWTHEFPAGPGGRENLLTLFDRTLEESIHLHHPRYIGHQVSPPLPNAILADLVTSLLNNGNTIYEMSPATTAMERSVIFWMARQLGYSETSGGVMTSGGSLGNLTALLAARQARAGFNYLEEGAHGGPPLAVLGSDQAHYSVGRAIQVMGWGTDGYIEVPSDDAFRLKPEELPAALKRAEEMGRKVIGVVAQAGSTGTGSYDPLVEIADFCEQNELWLHVDGAHGASVVLSDRYRDCLEGIERADSVVWDAHKMLMTPSLATGVLYREGIRAYEAFSEKAPYLGHGGQGDEWYNLFHRTVECTKRTMSLKLYIALATHGTDFFSNYITGILDQTRRFADMVRETSGFEAAHEPECNILCFRYLPRGSGQMDLRTLDAFQGRIRQRIMESGSFYIVQTQLRNRLYLRVTISNPFTSDADLEELLKEIQVTGDSILGE